ncbi:MAG: HI1450 family dsDNA-mimic protein [Aeromonadaceae bacterium]|nr:HI1450 family dsDNA-mimic protein [Aeromonadaceae bacterium]
MTADQLIEQAYDYFLQLAADHLSAEDLVDLTLEFEERGAVESGPPDSSWQQELGTAFAPHDWQEVWVGLLDHQQEFSQLYAKILVPLDGRPQPWPIRWKPAP